MKVHLAKFDNGGLISDAERSIAITNSNAYLIEHGEYSVGSRGDYPDGSEYAIWDTFSTLKNNKIVHIMTLSRSEVDLENGRITIYKIKKKWKREANN